MVVVVVDVLVVVVDVLVVVGATVVVDVLVVVGATVVVDVLVVVGATVVVDVLVVVGATVVVDVLVVVGATVVVDVLVVVGATVVVDVLVVVGAAATPGAPASDGIVVVVMEVLVVVMEVLVVVVEVLDDVVATSSGAEAAISPGDRSSPAPPPAATMVVEDTTSATPAERRSASVSSMAAPANPVINNDASAATITLITLLPWAKGRGNQLAWASHDIGPIALHSRPSEMFIIARTTSGSNWVPAQRCNSDRAVSADVGTLYDRADVITSKASATETILDVSASCSLGTPVGYPPPAHRSWCS